MQDPIVVRPARAQDKDAILAFCQNTFHWGDYIHEVWDDWLRDRRGQMFVGVVDGRPIGLVHVGLLDDGAAWLEGMRVHPDFRRRGVSSVMDATGRAYARERGYRLARLATGMDNLAAQRALDTQGYTRVAPYGEWTAKPIRGKSSDVEVAAERDLPKILTQWRESSPNPIVATPEWRWEKLNDATLSRLVREGKIRAASRGFAILHEMIDRNGLILHALAGDETAMHDLGRAARGEANYRGFTRVEAMVVDDPKINRALEHAGFQREGGMFIYEQVL